MPFLLDTNAWIDVLKDPSSLVRKRIESLRPSEVVTCSIVQAELRYGAEKYGNVPRRVSLVQKTLAPFRSAPFDDDVIVEYARLRHALDKIGKPIGPLDTMIAAICLHHVFTIVTHNVREFSRVPSLTLEDWQ